MHCWSCRKQLPDPAWGKITFRETCDHCGAALHCCKNCKYYKVGQPNDCLVPGTERISDKTATNFCEEFSLLSTNSPPKESKDKKRFDDLFK